MSEVPDMSALVSCLCITRGRVPLLARAVSCFEHQTYPNRELIIIYEDDDSATERYVATLESSTIRAIGIHATPKLPLGTLRNISIAASRGDLVAQWDDDDWYSPQRLHTQLLAMREVSAEGCILSRWLMHDALTNTVYVSGERAWEGSLVVARSVAPVYPELARGEDTEAVGRLLSRTKIAILNRPDLYVYTVHASNTWGRSHWEHNLRPHAQALSEADRSAVLNQVVRGGQWSATA